MKKSVVFNYSLDKTAGGAMSKFDYTNPPLKRCRLNDETQI
jgi:hypothetical protein